MMGKDEAAVEPHRKSNRLKGYDYSKAGYYFVTMCARDKGNWFGRVECEKTILNEYGKLAREIWCDIPRHYEQVQMDEFTAMPNHIHGIVIINEDVGTEHCSVPTDTRFGLLSKVVKSFKEAFVKALKERSERAGFQWQRSFYDHIIRNGESLAEIRKYILENPLRWEYDRENPDARRDGE